MKMKFRPFTAFLLILLLLAGVCTALFHMGFFDAFFTDEVAEIQQQGEGPVVRREVSNLVLPLEDSGDETVQDESGLKETDIKTENQPAEEYTAEKKEQEKADTVVPAVVDEKAAPEDKSAPEDKPASKPESVNREKADSPKPLSAKGFVKGLSSVCNMPKVEIKIALSSAAGKINWFNLDKPRRLVVDLYGKWENKTKSLYRIKNCPIQKVVLGEHPDKLRLVIYLDHESLPTKLKPVIQRHDKEVVLRLDF